MFIFGAGDSSQGDEYEFKALYMMNFVKFIEWPENLEPAQKDSITIGIIGQNPFGDATKAIDGKVAKDRKIVIKQFANVKSLESCDILFIPATEKANLKEILTAVRGKSVLTVGEHEDFASHGGIVGFYLENNKLRFEINTDNAADANLKINAQLLKLARVVKKSDAAPESKPASAPAKDKEVKEVKKP